MATYLVYKKSEAGFDQKDSRIARNYFFKF